MTHTTTVHGDANFAATDADELRTGLTQVAAVCAAWHADLDRRGGGA
ncbi:hypothetical protein AB0I72_19780 [Nocardiopsis sp. NPDC049922]